MDSNYAYIFVISSKAFSWRFVSASSPDSIRFDFYIISRTTTPEKRSKEQSKKDFRRKMSDEESYEYEYDDDEMDEGNNFEYTDDEEQGNDSEVALGKSLYMFHAAYFETARYL